MSLIAHATNRRMAQLRPGVCDSGVYLIRCPPYACIRTSGTVKARNMDSDGSIDMGLQCIRMRIWNPISIHAIQAQ